MNDEGFNASKKIEAMKPLTLYLLTSFAVNIIWVHAEISV